MMEAATALRFPRFLCRTSDVGSGSCVLAPHRSNLSFDFGGFSPVSLSRKGAGRFGALTRTAVWSSSPSSSDSATPIAPLLLESPIGQFLSQILLNHPHLLCAAVDQQLEQLQSARESEQNNKKPAPSRTHIVLFRRIAEVKAKERKKALEEILYASVVQKFVEVDVPLIVDISRLVDPSERIDKWPSQDDKLEKVHSRDAFEMTKNHLVLILRQRSYESKSVAPISKFKLGQIYAASVQYGYFLKRVDQRFQLEKSMKTLSWGSDDKESAIKQAMPAESRNSILSVISNPEVSSWSSPSFDEGGFGDGKKVCRLQSYVMSFDSDTLQMYATIRSEEAFTIIGKHIDALFGRPEVVITPEGNVDSSNDELIKISFGGLKRLILEAVAFGSFLWDNESYVDSRYHFVTN